LARWLRWTAPGRRGRAGGGQQAITIKLQTTVRQAFFVHGFFFLFLLN
jgi:hypothetical protein